MNFRTWFACLTLSISSFGFIHTCHSLELARLIGEHMVVQRDVPIPIWGWAEPGTQVRVEFNQKVKTVFAKEDGSWRVSFPKLEAGGPFVLKVEGKSDSIQLNDIWVGDVWLCSGQSNMEWPLHATENAEQLIQTSEDTLIRHFKIPRSWAGLPEQKLAGGDWQVNSPDTAGSFSAVGYYFAKTIRAEVDVPIGLVNSTWGGSSIQSWMDAASLGLDPQQTAQHLLDLEAQSKIKSIEVKQRLARWNAYSKNYENAKADWSAIQLDESDWVPIDVPALWESQDFAGLDGVAWYRKHFTLTGDQVNEDLELSLGRIDDGDQTYVNGQLIGETDKYDAVRHYIIDKKLLRVGDNTLAVRVTDTGGGGGMYSDAQLFYLKNVSTEISLSDPWLFKVDKGDVLVGSEHNQTSTALYNKMMHPLFQAPIKGVIWYQGETNAFSVEEALEYKMQFGKLIHHWRAQWNNKKLPFYWVQLASFHSGADTPEESPWAVLRESQTQTLAINNTGMAVTVDVGDADDIHPRNKETVGERLALHALKNEYGKKQLSVNGPTLLDVARKGQSLVLGFKVKDQLRVARGSQLLGFEIAGEDGRWHKAAAQLKKNTVIVTSDKVSRPVSVRYAWSDNPETANLSDGSSLPAIPFRKVDID